MATKSTPDAVRLTDANGVVVSVSADKSERLLAGGGYTKATARKAAAKSDD